MPLVDANIVHLHGVLPPAARLVGRNVRATTEEVATDS